MLVKNWMSKAVVTIEADDSIQAGMKLLKQHKIRMLPVTKKGQARRCHYRPGYKKGISL